MSANIKAIPAAISIVALFGFILCSLWMLEGCGTTGQRNTFNTLYSVGHATDSAVSAYFDGVVHRQFKTNGVPKVAAMYGVFQAEFRLALVAANFNSNAPPTAAIIVDAATIFQTIQEVK